MSEHSAVGDFSLAAVKLPFDTVLKFFAAYYSRYYFEMFDDEERAAGIGGIGVLMEGPGITTETPFEYPHLRSPETEHPNADNIHADMRLCSLSGQPDWTLLNGPGDYNFHVGHELKALSRAFDCTVYRFDFSERHVDGKPLTMAGFSASQGEGFMIASPTDRVVHTSWEKSVGKDGAASTRHSFFQSGRPDPAEDLSVYDRRGPRNKMNRQVLLDLMSRLGLEIGAFPRSQDVNRCVLIGDMGDGEPITVTADDIALINRVWPWQDS